MPAPESAVRYGILGGTFDPVHFGHLSLARQIMSKLNLDQVLFVPAYQHPFKITKIVASYADRFHMLELALSDHANFQLSDIERSNQLSGYTIDTVRALKAEFSDAELFFIIGADNLREISKWRESGSLQSEVRFAVGARPGMPLKISKELDRDRFELVQIDEVNMSASEIRAIVESGRGEELSRLVPASVASFIRERGLYS